MTYDQLIEVIRNRGQKFLNGTAFWEKGSIYEAVNSAVRDMQMTGKSIEATPATLSLVAGTRDYTISSSIATDCDDINMVVISTGSIVGTTLERLQDEIHFDVDDEDDITVGTPESYRVWNGVMRVYPTPDQAITATVYYNPIIAQAFYTTSIGAGAVPFDDKYISTIIYASLAILAENLGVVNLAEYYHAMAEKKQDDAEYGEATYNANTGVQYNFG